jgi:hypothetical protein
VDFVLGRGLQLVGRVLDPQGRPAAGALVRSGKDEWPQEAVTDALGRYRLGGVARAEEVWVSAVHAWWSGEGTAVVPGESPTLRVGDLRLSPPDFPLRVRVVGPSGEPVPGARVRLVTGMPEMREGACVGWVGNSPDEVHCVRFTGATGEAWMDPPPPGSSRLQATTPGTGGAALDLRVEPGVELPSVRMVLRPEARIRGEVVDPRGQPLGSARVTGGALITLRSVGAEPDATATWIPRWYHSCDRDGRFDLRGLPARVPLVLVASAPYFHDARLALDGDASALRFVLEPKDENLLSEIEATRVALEEIRQAASGGQDESALEERFRRLREQLADLESRYRALPK